MKTILLYFITFLKIYICNNNNTSQYLSLCNKQFANNICDDHRIYTFFFLLLFALLEFANKTCRAIEFELFKLFNADNT